MWSRKLNCGTEIYVKPDEFTGTTALLVWTRIGSIYEPYEIRGVSHFLEHMFFKGTEKYPPGANTKVLNAVGGDINAFTSFEFTGYMTITPKKHLEFGADIIFDMLRNTPVRDADFESEKKVIIEEMRMRFDETSRYTWDMLREVHFSRHPYREEIKGTEDTINGMKPGQMRWFKDRYYQPGNLLVTVAGAVDPEEAAGVIEKKLEGWKGTPVELPTLPEEPPSSGRRTRFITGDVNGAHLLLGYGIPGFRHEDTIALSALGDLLSGGRSSRLYRALVEKGLATVASGGPSIDGNFPGLFDIRLSFDPEKLENPVETVNHEIERIAGGDISRGEMELLKNSIEHSFLSSEESMLETVFTFGNYIFYDRLEWYERFLDHVRALTADDLAGAATRYLAGGAQSLVMYGRESDWMSNFEKRYGGAGNSEDADRRIDKAEPVTIKDSGGGISGDDGLKSDGPDALIPKGPAGLSRLEKKIRLVKMSRPARPLFSLSLILNGGFYEESSTGSGITSLLFNMLLRSRDPREKGDRLITHRLEALGAFVSPFVSNDLCGLSLTGLTRNFHQTIDAFADLFLAPDWSARDLERQKQVTIQAIAKKKDNLPAHVMTLFRKAFYGDFPYANELSGTEDSITGITTGHLLSWHSKIANSGRLVLSAVGALPDDTDDVFADFASKIPDGGKMTLDSPGAFSLSPEPSSSTETRDKHQVNILLGTSAPERGNPDRLPFLVLNDILSGMGNILWTELREKMGLCYVVYSSYSADLHAGVFYIYMGAAPARRAEALAAIRRVVKEFATSRIREEDLARAKQLLIGRYERTLERNLNRAYLYGINEALDDEYEKTDTFTERISAVTVSQVSSLARRYLSDPVWTEAVIHPPDA